MVNCDGDAEEERKVEIHSPEMIQIQERANGAGGRAKEKTQAH